MSAETTHNIEAMIIKLGDEDDYLLKSKFNRTVEAIQNGPSAATTKKIVSNLERFIQLVPGKSNVFASLLFALHSTHFELIEELMQALSLSFTRAINDNNEHVASNIMLFVMETVRVGLVGPLNFISILMDLISVCEKQKAKKRFLIRIIEASVPNVFSIFTQKYEMEYKNLLDDLQQLLNSPSTPGQTPLAEEKLVFDEIRNFQQSTEGIHPLFSFVRVDLSDWPPVSKPLRKGFKVVASELRDSGAAAEPVAEPRVAFFANKIASLAPLSSSWNTFMLNLFLGQLIDGFHKHPELLVERVLGYPWGQFAELKSWLFMENLFKQMFYASQFEDDKCLFVAKVVGIELQQSGNARFFQSVLDELSVFIGTRFDALGVSFLVRVTRVVALVNFCCQGSFSLTPDCFKHNHDLFYFANLFFAFQSDALSLAKTKASEAPNKEQFVNKRGSRRAGPGVLRPVPDVRGKA